MRLLPSLALLSALPALSNAFPNAPFTTVNRWIHDSKGNNFTYLGVNWPGHADVMVPEGLQYQSIASIVSHIKGLSMNVVRLTFAIEMVDDILDNGGDVPIQEAFTRALGAQNGASVYQQVVKNNPQFSGNTTRLQVFDAVAEELNKQGIYVHLDNHMSNGAWCCSQTDGDAWFGDFNFDVVKWKRGLQYMATHGAKWPNLVSIGLRNEPRQPAQAGNSLPYDWATWYTEFTDAANIVNAANPNILIFLSGQNYDTELTPIPDAEDLGNGQTFKLTDFKYADKLVLELHNYQNSATSCNDIEPGLWDNGFKALNASSVNHMPVVMTEFGYDQTDGSWSGVYATCIQEVLLKWKAGWTVWVLVGSYYIRSGTQDYDETWGLLNHDWSDWRNASSIGFLKALVQDGLE